MVGFGKQSPKPSSVGSESPGWDDKAHGGAAPTQTLDKPLTGVGDGTEFGHGTERGRERARERKRKGRSRANRYGQVPICSGECCRSWVSVPT